MWLDEIRTVIEALGWVHRPSLEVEQERIGTHAYHFNLRDSGKVITDIFYDYQCRTERREIQVTVKFATMQHDSKYNHEVDAVQAELQLTNKLIDPSTWATATYVVAVGPNPAEPKMEYIESVLYKTLTYTIWVRYA